MTPSADDRRTSPRPLSRRQFLLGIAGALTALVFSPKGEVLASGADIDCPIYFYHEVPAGPTFPRFVIDLLNRGGHPISPSTLAQALTTGERLWPEGKLPFVLTFDDGLLSQFQNAVPFLAQWSIPAAFAVMPGFPGDGRHRYLAETDMRSLADLGFEMMSHTIDHANLVNLRRTNPGAWAAEIVESRKRLEDITGRSVEFFCYPFGAYDRDTTNLVASNYRGALTTRKGRIHSESELYLLRRERRS